MAITATELKTAGYPISSFKDDAAVALAESDIKLAYFPTDQEYTDTDVIALTYALTYSLLIRRKIVATTYGSVNKKGEYSVEALEGAITSEVRNYCNHRYNSWLEDYFETNECYFEYTDIIGLFDNLFLL